jgi:hypothetical protein
MLNHEILLLLGAGVNETNSKWQKGQFLTFLLDFRFTVPKQARMVYSY